MNIISPSILASDFAVLGEEAASVEAAGADWLHIDVMDGHFVPNITIGVPVVASLRPRTKLLFDVHLMISAPQQYISDFAKAGAELFTFHLEADGDPRETIRRIRESGMLAAVALKPATPAEAVFPLLDDLFMVLVMTVEPGFGGQGFMADMLPKIEAVRREIDRRSLPTHIQVDGGITDRTVHSVAAAGADVFVAGSYIFRAPDRAEAVRKLRSADASL